MTATSLQTLLGLYRLAPELNLAVEIALAVVAALAAVALRRRKLVLRAPGFAMMAAGLVSDLLSRAAAELPPLFLSLEAIGMLLFIFGAIRLALELIDAIIRRGRAHFSTILRDLITVVLYAIVVLIVLRATLKVDLMPLLATSAVVTLVLGLGLQETLGNFFNGLTLQLRKPFDPGDWVRFREHTGRVLGIGWRSTRILTRAAERLEVPNELLTKEVLTNYVGGAVADEVSIGLPYSEPPNRVKEVALRVLASIAQVLSDPAPEILAWEYADFSIKYRLKYWLADWGAQERVRSEVVTGLWYALRRASIEIPFPIRTLYVHQARAEDELKAAREQAIMSELRQVDFLSALSDDELRMIIPTVRVHQFGGGEFLMREGEQGETFYLLRRGAVEVLARGANGSTLHIRDLEPPAFFGEISLMTGEPRSATVRATTDVEVLEISRRGFMQLFKARPEVADEIGEKISVRMTETRERVAAAQSSAGPAAAKNRLITRMRSIFQF